MQNIVNGERIRLRPYRNYEEYQTWRSLEAQEGSPFWGPMQSPGMRDRQAFASSGLFMDERGCFAIEELASSRHIGNEYYESQDGFRMSAQLGTRIHPEQRGRGFGVEAKRLAMDWLFGNYSLNLVKADTLDSHDAARRGLELSGMRLRGVMPCEAFSAGSWHAVVYYAITREEWKEGVSK